MTLRRWSVNLKLLPEHFKCEFLTDSRECENAIIARWWPIREEHLLHYCESSNSLEGDRGRDRV